MVGVHEIAMGRRCYQQLVVWIVVMIVVADEVIATTIRTMWGHEENYGCEAWKCGWKTSSQTV